MSDADRLQQYVAAWREACDDFLGLVEGLDDAQWGLPTDLPGWTVGDVVRHLAHLEAVLAGARHDDVELGEVEHVRGMMGRYTEQGVEARRSREHAEVLDELRRAVDTRAAELEADPPIDPRARPARCFEGVGWDVQTLLSNRVVDVWMHEQDIRRAVDSPGGLRGDAARHVVQVFLGGLGMVLGKRVGLAPGRSVTVELVDTGTLVPFEAGEDGRVRVLDAAPGGADLSVRMTVESFVVLAGGRRDPATVPVEVEGDEQLAARLLPAMSVTP